MKERREFRKRSMSRRIEEFWRKVFGDGMIESKILYRFNGRTSEVILVFLVWHLLSFSWVYEGHLLRGFFEFVEVEEDGFRV